MPDLASATNRQLPEVWGIEICPLCRGQANGGSRAVATHAGDCPNLGKTFASKGVPVVPLTEHARAERYREALDHAKQALAEASEELDEAGHQVAASNAHQAHWRAVEVLRHG